MSDTTKSPYRPTVGLRRVLTLGPLIFYGLSAIIGAGIYVAIGTVIGRAGTAAPLSFLIAGFAAAATGLCYAELSSRFPEAAGTVAYVKNVFGSDRLSKLAGLALSLAVSASAASVARGAIEYLSVLLPLPEPILITSLIVGFTAIAAMGVRESVGLAAAIGLLEIVGLILAIAAGFLHGSPTDPGEWFPSHYVGWQGVMAGAFIAFFSFIGFETLANMAEEVRNPRRNIPRGIICAIAISIILYVLVAVAAAGSPTGAGHPLIGLFEGPSTSIFAAIGFLAIANGVLVEIIMLARLYYGMARRAQLPALLGRVHPRTRVPLPATILAGTMILLIALLVPFEFLLVAANAFTLFVFLLVDLALWSLHKRSIPSEDVFHVPRWLPPIAVALVILLIASEFIA